MLGGADSAWERGAGARGAAHHERGDEAYESGQEFTKAGTEIQILFRPMPDYPRGKRLVTRLGRCISYDALGLRCLFGSRNADFFPFRIGHGPVTLPSEPWGVGLGFLTPPPMATIVCADP